LGGLVGTTLKLDFTGTRGDGRALSVSQHELQNVFKDRTSQMKAHRGKTHKYLGMSLDFSHSNQCRVTMIDYLDEIVIAYGKALQDFQAMVSVLSQRRQM
jgi:hypothetical protein